MTYELYAQTSGTPSLYTLSDVAGGGASTALATDANDTPLGSGWYDVETITVTAGSVSALTVHPGSPAATAVCLLQQTSATGYDDAGNVSATIDAKGDVTASTHDQDGNVTAAYQGQAISSVPGAAGYTPGGTPSWKFSSLTPNAALGYEICVQGSTTTGYTVKDDGGATLTITPADGTAPPLGDGWHDLGSVIAADAPSSLTVSGPAATAVSLLQQTLATGYDADGNVTATTDAQGRVTASSYDEFGNVVAGYQGQVVHSVDEAAGYTTLSSIPTWTFDSLSPDHGLSYDVYVHGTSADTSHGGYTLDDATYDPSGDPTAPLLGNGWTFVEAVTVSSDSTATLSISHGTSLAPDAVCLLQQTSTAGFDLAGDVLTSSDALNHQTADSFDDLGQAYSDKAPDPVTGAADTLTQTVYDPLGNVAATIDPLNNVTASTYDSFGEQTFGYNGQLFNRGPVDLQQPFAELQVVL